MRNIFVFIDGTGCTLETRSNIGSAYRAISDNDGCSRYYQPGIGTFSRIEWIDNLLAPNVDQKVIEAYQALQPLNLSTEDKIYIFGYSRGAVIARRLAMCLTSKDRLVSMSSRGLDFDKSVQAEVAYLCLFDPVIGWPRLYGTALLDHDAIMEPKIRSYVELISLDEARLMFPSDSYYASQKVRQKIESVSSISKADTTEDREAAYLELMVAKTRKSVWFPGTHADVGGHGKNKAIGAHALATSFEELFCILPETMDRSNFDMTELEALIKACSGGIEPIAQSDGLVSRIWKKLVGWKLLRSPRNRIVVQNLAHPLCFIAGENIALDGLPQYPTYSALGFGTAK